MARRGVASWLSSQKTKQKNISLRRKQCLHSLLRNYSKNLICKRKLIPKNPQNKQRKQFKNPTRGAWSKGFQDYQTPSWSGTCVADWEASHFSVMKTYRSAVAKANIQLMLNCYWDMWAPPLAPPPMFHPTTPPLPPPHLLLPRLTYCLVLWYRRLQPMREFFLVVAHGWICVSERMTAQPASKQGFQKQQAGDCWEGKSLSAQPWALKKLYLFPLPVELL